MMRVEDFCGVTQLVYERETRRGTTYDIAKWTCPNCGKANSTLYLEGDSVHGDSLSIRYIEGERTVGCGSCWLDDAIIAAKKQAAQPVAPAGWQPADGVCPNTGLPCGGYRKAIEHVIKALQYGVQHGYIGNPIAAAPTQEVPRHE